MTLSWLLVAAALALLGGHTGPRSRDVPGGVPPRRPRHRSRARRAGDRARPPRPAPGGRLSLPAMRLLAGAGGTVTCLALFGPPGGLPLAAVLVPAGLAALTRLHGRPPTLRAGPELALALDLVAVALRAGRPPAAALLLAAPCAGPIGPDLARVGGLLRLGADPAVAWQRLAGRTGLTALAAAATRSADSGVRLATAFEQQAAELRAGLRARAAARAERVGVLVAAPLGLCFLPAFLCLGIVPTVIGVAGAALAGG